MNSIESIPQDWNDKRDGQFFHLTASLFAPAFCYGAGVLLASYDPDDALDVATPTQAPAASESVSEITGVLR